MQARRPATFIEYQTFGKKGLGMGNSVLFSHFGKNLNLKNETKFH